VGREFDVTIENDIDEFEVLQVALDPRMAHAVRAMAQQGYLGSTPEQVIEHCLRQHLFEHRGLVALATAKCAEVPCE